MRHEDLGIDSRTGHHRKNPLALAESRYLGILWENHVGASRAISADHLAERFGRLAGMRGGLEQWKRDIRLMQNHLLVDHNIPILSRSGHNGGYWIAESEAEARAFYDTFRRRGMTGLVKASRGRQAALVDMVQQLSFEFDELTDLTPPGLVRPQDRPAAEMPTPVEVVDAFLGRMLRNPEKFADGLRKIGKKYGGVLLPRERIAELKVQAARFQELVGGLDV